MLRKTCFLEIKAKICKLVTKLYIDQEPRRIQILPELCKIVNVSNEATGKWNNFTIFIVFKEEKLNTEDNIEGIDMELIKSKVVGLIKNIVYLYHKIYFSFHFCNRIAQ